MSSITLIKDADFDKWWTVNLDMYEIPAVVLGPEAKLLHLYLASRPKDWKYRRTAAINLIGSGYKLDKAVSELKEIGLLVVTPKRVGGRFCGHDWHVKANISDSGRKKIDSLIAGIEPAPDNQDMEPYHDSQDSVIPDSVNHDALKEIPFIEKKPSLEKQSIVHQAAHAHDPNQLSLFSDQEFEAELRRRTGDHSLSISKVSDSERSDLPAAACGKVDKSGKKILPRGGHAPDAFAAFWEQHPIKKGKLAAQTAWNRLKANSELISTIMHDMANRKQNDRQWVEGFAPHPATYLNGARWTDEIEPLTIKKTGVQSSQSGKPSEEEQMAYLRSYLND